MTPPAAAEAVRHPLEAPRAHPVWLGLAVAAGVLAASLLARVLFGDGDLLRYLGVDVLTSLLMGYLPAADAWLRQSVVRDFETLRPVLSVGEEERAALLSRALRPGRGVLLAGGCIGAATLALMPLLDPSFWPEGRPPLTSPLFLFLTLRQVALGFLAGRVVAFEVASVRAYRYVGRTSVTVDLMDVGRLRTFARRGLRSGFVWLLCSSLVSLFWLGPAPSSGNGPIIGLIGLLVLAGFGVCVSGVRDAIRDAKAERLEAVRAAVRRESEALLSGGAREATGDTRLADLVALQGLIERVPEWPFDAPVLLRFGLLALLGLGSWLGGALVERLVDVALG